MVKRDRIWTVQELPDLPHNAASRRMAEHLFQKHPMWWEPASVPVAGQQQRHPILFRIVIARMTGRRAGPEAPGGNAPDAKRPTWLARIRLRKSIRG